MAADMAADLMCGAVVTPGEEVDQVQPDSAVLIDGPPPGEVSSGGRLPLAARQYHAVVHLHVKGTSSIRQDCN